MTRVFISLGSNINPQTNLPAAISSLRQHLQIIRVSKVYRTTPVGSSEQADFLNAAALAESELPPTEIKFNILRRIEEELGRVRGTDKFAPRTIDLDLALYGSSISDNPAIPDPDILRHAHVAVPLADLDPDFPHPVTGETLKTIARWLSSDTSIDATTLTL